MPELPDARDFEAERDELRGWLESREDAPESPESPGPSDSPTDAVVDQETPPERPDSEARRSSGGVGCS